MKLANESSGTSTKAGDKNHLQCVTDGQVTDDGAVIEVVCNKIDGKFYVEQNQALRAPNPCRDAVQV